MNAPKFIAIQFNILIVFISFLLTFKRETIGMVENRTSAPRIEVLALLGIGNHGEYTTTFSIEIRRHML